MTDENLTLHGASPVNGNGDLPVNIVSPNADVYETTDAYVVRLDMPGARKEAISLTLEKGILQVSAEVGPHHGESSSVLYRELRATGYHRVFTLGDGIDRDTVDALFEDGVLTVKLFKTPETKPLTITIH